MPLCLKCGCIWKMSKLEIIKHIKCPRCGIGHENGQGPAANGPASIGPERGAENQ